MYLWCIQFSVCMCDCVLPMMLMDPAKYVLAFGDPRQHCQVVPTSMFSDNAWPFLRSTSEFQLTSLDGAAMFVSLRRWCGTEKKKDYNFQVLVECHNLAAAHSVCYQ